jgi:hypothetical protein
MTMKKQGSQQMADQQYVPKSAVSNYGNCFKAPHAATVFSFLVKSQSLCS